MKKGFTLLEVLVVAVLFAILGAGVLSFIVLSHRTVNDSVKEGMIESNLTRIKNSINTDIRNGCILETPTDNNELRIIDTDSVITQWVFSEGKLYRNKKPVLLIGLKDAEIEGTFNSELESKYFYADISLKLKPDGVSYVNDSTEVSTTRVYCRHDPNGYFDPSVWINE